MDKSKIVVIVVFLAAGIATLSMLSSSRPPPAQDAFGGSSTPAEPKPPVSETARESDLGRSAASNATSTPNPSDSAWLDGIVIADQFKALLERARKDPAFAHSFARALHQCANADRAYRNLAKAADQPTTRDSSESKLRDLDRRYAKCAGLTTEQMEQRYDLITLAARAGVLAAQKMYLTIMQTAVSSGYAIRRPNYMDEIRANGEAFTLAAAHTGDPDALMNAFMFYDQGMLVPRDPVRAYQFLTQFVRANPSASSQALLARYASKLSPEQRR